MEKQVNYKDEGNEFFNKGDFKQAAVSYTKGIQEDPQNHVLYSNRSAAFLQMARHQRALGDADACIQIKPDWAKGYYRRAKALEALQQKEVLLETIEKGLTLDPASADLIGMIKLHFPSELHRFQHKKSNPQPTPSVPKDDRVFSEEVMAFAQTIISEIRAKFAELNHSSPDDQVYRPCAYLLPNKADQAQPVISVEKAFSSPTTLEACTEYLRQMIIDETCKAALIIVQKSSIAYPQNWKNKSRQEWNFDDNQDGLFIQLETKETPDSSTLRLVHFLPMNRNKQLAKDPIILNSDHFALTRPLFK